MKSKKIISLALCAVMALGSTGVLSACKGKEDIDANENTSVSETNTKADVTTVDAEKITASDDTASATTTQQSEELTVDTKMPELNPEIKNDTENEIGYQLEMPQKGDEIAIIHTNMGDITLRLFPENAPKTVENFVTLAKEGKYDNTIFHRVMSDFMIQGGDFENGDGTGGYSIYGDKFEDEFCNTLYNIRGSVAMANASAANTNGSQFFINQKSAESFDKASYDYNSLYVQYTELYAQFCTYYTDFTSYFANVEEFISNYIGGIAPLSYEVPDEVWELYEENGGNITLDGALRASGGHTVFAQVIEGMDVVDAIAAVEVVANSSGELSQPAEDVIVKSIEITTY